MKPGFKKAASFLLALGIAAGSAMYVLPPESASAQQVPGSSPFVNSWLVSGPFNQPVADLIYGTESGLPLERPADGNWARIATVSASSTWQQGSYSYPDKTDAPSPKQLPEKAVDGDKATCWLSQMHDADAPVANWPSWDPKPVYRLEWRAPITVKEVRFFNRHDNSWTQPISEIQEVQATLYNAAGTQLGETVIVKNTAGNVQIDPTGKNPGVADFGTPVAGVSKVELAIIHNGKKELINVGLGFTEVEVYDGEPIVPPAEPDFGVNLAPKATPTASSSLGANPPSNLTDGNIGKQWVCENDTAPWVQLTWDEPVDCNEISIALWADSRHKNKNYDLTFTLDDGTVIGPERLNDTTGDPTKPAVFEYDGTLQKVKSLKVEIDKGLSPYPSVTGISEITVVNRSKDVYDVNLAPKSTPTASTALAANPPTNLVDGKKAQWVSLDGGVDKEPWVQLAWDKPVTFNEVSLTQWGDSRHVNNYYDLTFTFADATTMGPVRVKASENPTLYSYRKGYLRNVTAMKVEIDKGRDPYPSITGISEIEVYNRAVEEDKPLPPEKPAPGTPIKPVLGEELAQGGESSRWEYFDDRIYNRNYDDYQDLSGYFTIKKGIDTKNKFVYAHTYVYSPKRQWAQLRMGASGSYRVYLNDQLLTNSSVPAEVQKDMSKLDVVLNQGWNKVLIQMEHTYTEDVNANNVPVAKDQNVSYLGFYGRVTDKYGDAVEGVRYSVTLPKNEDNITIVTQGLSAADVTEDGMGLPENNMPAGYREWPYVWNKSTTNNAYGLSASAFQFQAAGGDPSTYKWKIAAGSLPDNLVLTEDGRIADGLLDGAPDLSSSKGIIPASCEVGDFTFTVQVTDGAGKTAEKEFTITVKERPNKWFEEGRVGALSHCITIPTYFVDPNFSADLWAERAKREGHSLVSIEALQQNYYWPSKFADPKHDRNQYMPKDENGQVVDGLKQFELAVKRYGIKFGLYYATEGGGLQHYSTDVFVQNVSDLITRYQPAYLYFDGPQAMRSANYDVMYSNVRNYNDEIIINANAWGEEFGDPDLGTHESSGIYSNVGQNHFVKKVVFEPWKSVHTKNNYTPYYAKRDDYRQVTKEMIMNAGRGYVDNNDQMPLMSRGTNWDSPEDVATRYPKSVQEFIDVREGLASWFAPEGLPERHESTTGTTPYFLAGYGYEDDGKGNYDRFAHPNGNGTGGPTWGYATYRDNNIYLHIIEGPDGKKGFGAIPDGTLTLSPFADSVQAVTWLNEDIPLSFEQNGGQLTLDLSEVSEDPIDTIIKITTDSPERKYKLTNLYLEGEQLSPDALKITVEGQMTYPALKAELEDITFASSDPAIASVDAEGIVSPGKSGTTAITVQGTYEGTTVENTISVTSQNGMVYVGDELLSAALHVNGYEVYGQISSYDTAEISIEGRSVTGGPVGLDAAEITWHGGIVDLKGGDKSVPIKINESDIFTVEDRVLHSKPVESHTRAVIWADVDLDGKTYTSNRVYLDLLPYENIAMEAEITASINEEQAPNLTDGQKIEGIRFDESKWSAPANEESWLQFQFNGKQKISSLDINFNSLNQNYYNTPKKFDIQTSEDGENWTTLSTHNGPTGSAYFGFCNSYDAKANTEYLRLLFHDGANGSAVDILEVSVNGFYKASKYAVQVSKPENGSLSADKAVAAKGETVKLTVKPDKGYQLKAGSLRVNGGKVNLTVENTFVMPAENVTITAEFELLPPNVYAVTFSDITNGTVTADKLTAAKGETVKLILKPDKGYQLKAGSLKLNGGRVALTAENTFVMPAESVNVTAKFEKQEAPEPPENPEIPGSIEEVKDAISKLPNPQPGAELSDEEKTLIGTVVEGIAGLGAEEQKQLSAQELVKLDKLVEQLGIKAEKVDSTQLLSVSGLALSAGTTDASVKVKLTISAEETDMENALLALDMSYFINGKKEQPRFPLRFEMALPKELRGKEFKLVHVTDSGSLEEIELERKGNTIVFWAESFSSYVFVETGAKPQPPVERQGNPGKTIDVLITIEAGLHGKISPDKFAAADFGDSVTLTVTPDEGYEVDKAFVDDKEVMLTNGEYVFTDVIDYHSFRATFRPIMAEAEESVPVVPDMTTNPKTGDATPALPLALLALASGIWLIYKKVKEN